MKVIKSYTEETLKTLVPQGQVVKFEFPNTFTPPMQEEIKTNPKVLRIPCTCTGYSIQPEKNQITFEVKAPTYMYVNTPQLKVVQPTYKGVEQIMWDIQFNVNNESN